MVFLGVDVVCSGVAVAVLIRQVLARICFLDGFTEGFTTANNGDVYGKHHEQRSRQQ